MPNPAFPDLSALDLGPQTGGLIRRRHRHAVLRLRRPAARLVVSRVAR
jgi:hypothetical protein